MKMLPLLLFGRRKTATPLKAYMVGLLGCRAIKSIYHGKDDGGLDVYSYRVYFKNKKSIEITNPFYYVE